MSQVLARFRGKTDCQCLTDARKLREDLLPWCFKEENIPRKYRSAFVPKIKEIIDKLVNSVRKAQYAYPTDASKLQERKIYIKMAIDSAVDLWQELQCLDDARRRSGGLNLTRLEPILTQLWDLQGELKAWEKNNKIQSKE